MSKIAVAGGGAAGMIAAVFAARNGNEVSLYEKNEKLGKKLFITGKGRCNLTNTAEMEDMLTRLSAIPNSCTVVFTVLPMIRQLLFLKNWE